MVRRAGAAFYTVEKNMLEFGLFAVEHEMFCAGSEANQWWL